jgi:phage/plasmid-associated DNA primase
MSTLELFQTALCQHYAKIDKSKKNKRIVPEITLKIEDLELPFQYVYIESTPASELKLNKTLVYNSETNDVHETDEKSKSFKFNYVGKLSRCEQGLTLYKKSIVKSQLVDELEDIMISLNTHDFFTFISKYFDDEFLFDPSEIQWYYNDNGKWKSGKSGKECPSLAMKIKIELLGEYENKKNQIAGKYVKACEKATKGIEVRYKGGTLNQSKTKYVRGNIQIKTKDNKWATMEDGSEFESKLEEAIGIHEQLTILDHYIEKISDAIRFVPTIVDRLRDYFIVEDLVKEFDTDPYLLAFNNCYLNLNDTLKTRKVYPLPHHNKNFVAMSTRGNFMKKENVENQIEKINTSLLRSFNGDMEKYETLLKTKSYSLFGENPMKVIFINYGRSGDNGKGFVDTLQKKALGDYHTSLNSEMIIQTKKEFDFERPQPGLRQAMKARFVTLTEIDPGSKLCGKKIKHLRGGDDMTVRTLNKEPVTLTPQFTIDCGFNDVGEIDPNDKALKKSIFIIYFGVEFKKKSEEFKVETDTMKFSNNLKEIIAREKDYMFGSAWLWILLPHMMKEFDNHPEFENIKKSEIESTDYVKEFFDDEIVDTQKADEGIVDFNYLQPMAVYKKASLYIKSLGSTPPIKKRFLEQFEKYLDGERIFRNVNKNVNGKHVRNYYKNYQFTSELNRDD